MNIIHSPLPDLVVVDMSKYFDARGAFSRLYCERKLENFIKCRRIVQINLSVTNTPGAIRGLHYQIKPHAEMKLVRCIRGRVWDVAVDLRKNSSTFLEWHAEELTPDNNRMMVIPEGFAHGFQALEADTELLYLHTAFYTPSAEGGLRFNDPAIRISWPLSAIDVSERDARHPFIDSSFEGITL